MTLTCRRTPIVKKRNADEAPAGKAGRGRNRECPESTKKAVPQIAKQLFIQHN
jgi:hypothetical protein